MHRFPGGTSPSFRWLHCIQGVTPTPGLLPSHPTVLHSGAWLKYLRKRRLFGCLPRARPVSTAPCLPPVPKSRASLGSGNSAGKPGNSDVESISPSAGLRLLYSSPVTSVPGSKCSQGAPFLRAENASFNAKLRHAEAEAPALLGLGRPRGVANRPSQPPRALGSHGPAGPSVRPLLGVALQSEAQLTGSWRNTFCSYRRQSHSLADSGGVDVDHGWRGPRPPTCTSRGFAVLT